MKKTVYILERIKVKDPDDPERNFIRAFYNKDLARNIAFDYMNSFLVSEPRFANVPVYKLSLEKCLKAYNERQSQLSTGHHFLYFKEVKVEDYFNP